MRINPNKNFKDFILNLNHLIFHHKIKQARKELSNLLNSILKTKLNGDLKLYQVYKNSLEQLYFNFNYQYFKWVKENYPEKLEEEIKRFKNREHENILISLFSHPEEIDDLFFNLKQYIQTKNELLKKEANLILKLSLKSNQL